MNTRKIVFFCTITMVLSWSLQLFVLHHFRSWSNPAALPWIIAGMYTPALGALISALADREARRRLLWKPSWRMLPYVFTGLAAFLVIGFATVATMHFSGWGTSTMLTFSHTGVSVLNGPWLLGKGHQNWLTFICNVLLTGGYFAVLDTYATTGEELGWRGYLQGLLTEQFGINRGIVVLALIWAAWHLPFLLAGFDYPEHPVIGALVLFPIQVIAASFILGWLTIRSGSFWAAAVAHATVNSMLDALCNRLALHASQLHVDVVRIVFTAVVGGIAFLLLQQSPRRVHH